MKMTCSNCAGRSDDSVCVLVKGEVREMYVCTQRDSDKWASNVFPDDTCLDWEPVEGPGK